MGEYRAFSITIRFKDNYAISQSDIGFYIKQFKSRTQRKTSKAYIYAITEKESSQKHFHIAMFVDDPVKKGSISTYFKRQIEGRFSTENYKFPHCLKVDIMYNLDWLNNYLKKGDQTKIIFNHLPQNLEEYIPSAEKQEEWKQKQLSGDKFFAQLKIEFLEFQKKFEFSEISINKCATFLAYREHPNGLSKPVIRCDRIAQQTCKNLYWYLQVSPTPTHIDKFIDDGSKKLSPCFEPDNALCDACGKVVPHVTYRLIHSAGEFQKKICDKCEAKILG